LSHKIQQIREFILIAQDSTNSIQLILVAQNSTNSIQLIPSGQNQQAKSNLFQPIKAIKKIQTKINKNSTFPYQGNSGNSRPNAM
jgi:hypothetical protein